MASPVDYHVGYIQFLDTDKTEELDSEPFIFLLDLWKKRMSKEAGI